MSMTVLNGESFQVKWIIPAGTFPITENMLNLTIIESDGTVTHYRDTEYTFTFLASTNTTDGYIQTLNLTPTKDGIYTVNLNLDDPSNNKIYYSLDSISVFVASQPSGNLITTTIPRI